MTSGIDPVAGEWFASAADVRIGGRPLGSATTRANVAVCGDPSGPRNHLVQALIRHEATTGAKVIVLDSSAEHQNLTSEGNVCSFDASVLHAFADPAELLSEALRDHDIIILDLASTLVAEEVWWPPVETTGVPMLRLLLEAQRVTAEEPVVIVIDNADLVLGNDQLRKWAEICLREADHGLTHVVVCDDVRLELGIDDPGVSAVGADAVVALVSSTGEVLVLEYATAKEQ